MRSTKSWTVSIVVHFIPDYVSMLDQTRFTLRASANFEKFLEMQSPGPDCRANWTVACEMGEGKNSDVYYGRVLKLVVFELDAEHSSCWPQWQTTHEMGLFDWASGLEIGMQGQVYKDGESNSALLAETIEDVRRKHH